MVALSGCSVAAFSIAMMSARGDVELDQIAIRTGCLTVLFSALVIPAYADYRGIFRPVHWFAGAGSAFLAFLLSVAVGRGLAGPEATRVPGQIGPSLGVLGWPNFVLIATVLGCIIGGLNNPKAWYRQPDVMPDR